MDEVMKPKLRSVATMFFGNRKRGALTFALIFAIIGTALLLFSHAAVNNGSGPINLIVLGMRDGEEDTYAPLINSHSQTNLSFRNVDVGINSYKVTLWDSQGRNYYYTAASSDYIKNGQLPTLYDSPSNISAVLGRPANKGIYFHELVTYYANQNGYNWQAAIGSLNWGLLDQDVRAAKSQGKKVVWSEPSYAWQNLASNSTAQSYLKQWGSTVVPTYATNYPNQVNSALSGAKKEATLTASPLGESVQSWYFDDQVAPSGDNNPAPTESGTLSLINTGYNGGSKYFQIEGSNGNMQWGSAYMNGVYDFAKQLASQASTSSTSSGGTTSPTACTGCWHSWDESVGGTVISKPSVVSWGSGHLDVFAIGTNNQVYHKYYYNGAWSSWYSLGGNTTYAPAVVSWGWGRIDLFIRDASTGALFHKWYDGGTWYSGWENLGGYLTSAPSAASWGSGHIDVFVRGYNGAVYHKWYLGGWSGWASLGGYIQGNPAAVSWGYGRIDTFVRGSDNALYHNWFDGSWHYWENLGGYLTSGPGVATWGSGHLDVFARSGDNAVWHKWFLGGWSNWASLGGYVTSDPAAVSWGYGRIDLFARGTDNGVWHNYFQ
jgi:hypothetical protein